MPRPSPHTPRWQWASIKSRAGPARRQHRTVPRLPEPVPSARGRQFFRFRSAGIPAQFPPHHGKDLRVYDQQLVHTLSQDSKYLCFSFAAVRRESGTRGSRGSACREICPAAQCGVRMQCVSAAACRRRHVFCLCGKPGTHLLPPEKSMLHRKMHSACAVHFAYLRRPRLSMEWFKSEIFPPIPS